jgi:hypothetical protein
VPEANQHPSTIYTYLLTIHYCVVVLRQQIVAPALVRTGPPDGDHGSIAPAAGPVAPVAATAPPLRPLASALASGQAYFAHSPITAVAPGATRGIRNLTAKAETIFAAFPAVTVGTQGIRHELNRLTFVELDLAGSRYLVGCGKAAGRPLSPEVETELVTGMCLHGIDSIRGWADGRAYSLTVGAGDDLWARSCPIDRITIDQRWHVYEAETLIRLVPFVRDLARLHRAPVRIRAHIPGPEYELYALGLYARGLLPARLCAQYRAAVQRRARLVAAALKRCLDGAADVTVSSPLRLVSGLDVKGVPRSGILRLVYDAVCHHDPLWRVLLGGQAPSFSAITYASFRYTYLAAARRAAEEGHQVAFAENPDELPIHYRALEDSGRTGISLDHLAGFYVHPMAVVTSALDGRTRLLRECANGCEPGTVAAAMDCYAEARAPAAQAEPWRLLAEQPQGSALPSASSVRVLEFAG